MLFGDTWAPSGKPLLRYGEATNPGPERAQQKEGVLDLDFKDPTQEGFWGALLPGADLGSDEAGGKSVKYQLLVDTCNGTSWSSVARFLTRTRADIVLVQEHHLGPSQVAAASKWAGKRGWQTVWSAAERGEGAGWRAGVCICARAPVALSMPRKGGAVVCGARVVSAVAEAPGYGQIAVYSVYLRDGEGLSRANLGTLAALGNHAERLGPNAPFIIGGDFQMPPSRIAAAGLAEKVHAVIAASGNPKGTCRTARSRTNIDYFYVSNGLANGVQSIRTVEATSIKTHVPVGWRCTLV
jgi:exonuclease III